MYLQGFRHPRGLARAAEDLLSWHGFCAYVKLHALLTDGPRHRPPAHLYPMPRTATQMWRGSIPALPPRGVSISLNPGSVRAEVTKFSTARHTTAACIR